MNVCLELIGLTTLIRCLNSCQLLAQLSSSKIEHDLIVADLDGSLDMHVKALSLQFFQNALSVLSVLSVYTEVAKEYNMAPDMRDV